MDIINQVVLAVRSKVNPLYCKGCIWRNSHDSLTPQGPGAETKAVSEAALPFPLSYSLIVLAHSPPRPRRTPAGHFIRYTLQAECSSQFLSRAVKLQRNVHQLCFSFLSFSILTDKISDYISTRLKYNILTGAHTFQHILCNADITARHFHWICLIQWWKVQLLKVHINLRKVIRFKFNWSESTKLATSQCILSKK